MSENEIIKIINKNWRLTNVRIWKLLQNWWDRFVYKILSDEWKFVLKISWIEKKECSLIKDLYIFDYSKENNFDNLPNLIKTYDNKNYARYKNRFSYMINFIEWGEPENNITNRKEIWKIMAKLHNFKNYKYYTEFTIESEKENFKQKAKELKFWNEYIKIVNNLPDFSKCSMSVIHSDIWLHNTIKDKNWKIYFIDRDDCWIWLTILDLWFPLISIFLNHELKFDFKNAKAFYSSYFENKNLKQFEKNLIFDAALFFVLMYIPYWNVDENWKRIQFAIKNKNKIISVLG